MDDFFDKKPIDDVIEEDADNPTSVEEGVKRRVPPQLTIVEALDILELYKMRMVDENYEEMLEDGEAQVRTPLEVVDALEVLLYFVNTSFNMDEEI